MNNGKKLRRSSTDKRIFGVCGGIGEYFGIDPLWVRLAWALLIVLYGTGIVLYLLCALIIPSDNSDK